jgi:hypothetical protein
VWENSLTWESEAETLNGPQRPVPLDTQDTNDHCYLSLPSRQQALLPDSPEAPDTAHQSAPAAGLGAGGAQVEANHLLAQHQQAHPLPQVSQQPLDSTLWICPPHGTCFSPQRPTPTDPPVLQAGSEQGCVWELLGAPGYTGLCSHPWFREEISWERQDPKHARAPLRTLPTAPSAYYRSAWGLHQLSLGTTAQKQPG